MVPLVVAGAAVVVLSTAAEGRARFTPLFGPGGGAPIERTWVQAGVVGGITAEVQARQFFSGLGFNVRSRGAPGLGRRIFIGPFATEGGLQDAMQLARDFQTA